jgi:predicted DNA-binding transcriptional regulator YafY
MVNPHDFDEGTLERMMVDKIQETVQISSALRDSEELGKTNFGDRIQLEKNPSGEIHLSTIIKSIRDNIVIRFVYQGFWNTEEEYVSLKPYFVKMAQRRWYVIGLRDDTGEMENFCLDRILQLALTTDRFTIPKNFNFRDYFKHSFGALIEKGIDVEVVKIKVWGEQVKYLRSLPIHESQKEIREEKDYSVFQFHLRPTYDFKMEILSHGSSWEVIQPKWFRQDVASGFRMGYRLYYVDGRENKSEECKKMRDLLLSWTPVISKYANGDTVIFVENINNPREPQMSLQVKDQYSVIVGYNDMDKLYLGVKYENDTNAKEVKHSLDTMRINIMLPLRTDGWYGWQKMTNDNGLNLIISILERLGLHSK